MGRDQYAAMKIDIVQSRVYPEREKLQEVFLEVTERANKRFEKIIIARFVVTHGDELQALLRVDEEIVEVIHFFMEEMDGLEEISSLKIRLRVGIGIGTLTTSLNQEAAIGMDGPAFNFAKDAIDYAHDRKKYAVVKTASSRRSQVINTVLDLQFALREEWNRTQQRIIRRAKDGLSQAAIAAELGISQPAVSKNLAAAKWKVYEEATQTLKLLFNELNADEPVAAHLQRVDIYVINGLLWNDKYEFLLDMLENESNFRWKDCSFFQKSKTEPSNRLKTKIAERMRPVQCVIVLSDMYFSRGKWVKMELEVARELNKPIIAVRPWGSVRTPKLLEEYAAELVGWNTDEIVKKILAIRSGYV